MQLCGAGLWCRNNCEPLSSREASAGARTLVLGPACGSFPCTHYQRIGCREVGLALHDVGHGHCCDMKVFIILFLFSETLLRDFDLSAYRKRLQKDTSESENAADAEYEKKTNNEETAGFKLKTQGA